MTGEPWLLIQMLCRGWGYKAGHQCKTMACVAPRRGFSFSSLSLGFTCAFSSICACGQLTGVFSWGCPRAQDSADCGGVGWGLKSPTWVEFFVVLDEQRATQGTWDAMGFLFGRHSPMALCSMVVQASPQGSCLQSSSLMPIPSGCFLIASSSPLPRSALQSPHFSTQPLSALADMPLRLGGQGWGQHPVCRSHSVLLPHAGCHVFFPQRMRLSFSPNWAPPVRLSKSLKIFTENSRENYLLFGIFQLCLHKTPRIWCQGMQR